MKTGMARAGAVLVVSAALAPIASATDRPQAVVGFMMVDAAKYWAEEQRHSPYGTRVLAKNGFGFGLYEYQTLFGVPTTAAAVYDTLRQFHVAVLDSPFDNSIMDLGPARLAAVGQTRQGLERYVREGGGLLLILQAVRYPSDRDQDCANLVFEGLGVRMLEEGVFDLKRQFTTPIGSMFQPEGFFWTENVTAGHPVTEGVRRLCLPEHHSGANPGVVAMALSPDWQVLVRGEASAQSYRMAPDRRTDYQQVGTYRTAPPIVAVRTFGRGRVVAYSVPARCVYLNYGVPGWNMIVEEAGDVQAQRPSDSARLVLNALKWLAEPARGQASIGTFQMKPPERVKFPKSVEYDTARFNPPVKGVRGLVGARTRLSDGSGTVEDYAAAARAAGLAFIVFTESLEQLTAAELEELKAACKRVSTDTFHACPGVEFSDDLDNRWALWCERVAYPPATYQRTYGPTTAQRPALKQWDGRIMHNPGQYWALCGYSPNALLTYRNLRQRKAHPVNLWWFFRVAPLVYTRTELKEDNFAEFLFALRDCRAVDPVAYTRVYSPAEVAAAAATCTSAGRDLASLKDWINGRCANYGHPARPYVTQGPRIDQWEVINNQYDLPLDVRGIQRARCRFEVASEAGIREVRVHDADFGLVRRFLGRGQPTFAQEFEMVHDRDHYLVLEVIDGRNKRAISSWMYLWCYKTSLFRCADNLNFLNGVGLVWHPYNEMMPLAQMYQGTPAEAVRGYDTAAALTCQATLQLWPLDAIQTAELKTYPLFRENGALRKVLDVKLPGNDVKILEMTMDPLVEPFDTVTRDTPAMANVPAVIEDNKLFTRTHRTYYLQNRNNMFITWNYRRAYEGAEHYRGGMAWHEGRFTFKRDATLQGAVPIPLFYLRPAGDPQGTATHVLVQDAQAGPISIPIPKGQALHRPGEIAPGGYLTVAPCDVYVVFYAGAETRFRYLALSDAARGTLSQLLVGLGRDGQKVRAGEVLAYRFGMATLGGPRQPIDAYAKPLRAIGSSFGIGAGGVQPQIQVGEPAGREMFLTLKAVDHEVEFTVKPHPTIIDLPIRVEGVEDNGCAAVWSTARPWFRWVGVAEGSAWFQENVDTGSTIWAGNVFVCDNKAVRLTLVTDGQAPDKPPFLEVHNPTDQPVEAAIASPPHAPLFGGTRLKRTVPAGTSVKVVLTATKG